MELFAESTKGTPSPLLIIRTPGHSGTIAIRADKIRQLKAAAGFQEIPVYDPQNATFFRRAFVEDGRILICIDTDAIAKQLPEAINLTTEPSTNAAHSQHELQLNINCSHWLAYGLSILHARKQSGQLELNTDGQTAWISLTAGHPTYASLGLSNGIEALERITATTEWTSYKWHPQQSDAAPNITKPVDEILTYIKEPHLTC